MAAAPARTGPAPAGRVPGRRLVPQAAAPCLPAPARRRRLLVLGICCSGIFLAGLDSTALIVALPSIGHDLRVPVPGLQWTVDVYLLVLASMQLAAGSAADRFGRRRVFQGGLGLFALGSLLCSLAPALGWLLAARVIQAAGGSMLSPAAMSVITVTFTDRAERARAVSIWYAVFGISMACGPVLGGVVVAAAGWQGIFWMNIPVALAAAAMAARFMPESRARRPDPAGQALVIVMLGSLTCAIIEGPAAGWSSPQTAGLLAGSAAALAALIAWEPRRAEPVIDLRLFGSLQFSGAIAAAAGTFAALGGFLVLSALYLQDIRGFTPVAAGLHIAPMAAPVAICAPLAGRLAARRNTRAAMLIAGSAITLSCAALAAITSTVPGLYLLGAYAVFGAGIGFADEPITYAAVSGVPPAQAGLAGGLNSSSRMVGQVLGVAVAGPVLLAHLHGPMRAGFTAASWTAWCVLAGIGYAVLLAGVLATGGRAAATAAPAAALIPGPARPRGRGAVWQVLAEPAGRHAAPSPVPSWLRALISTRKTQTPPPANGGRH